MNIVGIDLGTTFSGLAVIDEIGNPAIIPNSDGDRITPSVVFFDPDDDESVVIGEDALKNMDAYPDRVFAGVKGYMGTGKVFNVGDQAFTPTEISALFLKKLIQGAEWITGEIDTAVITVPANFLENARVATKEAGQLAGLKKVALVNKPNAIALQYATSKSSQGRSLVFELSSGTLDVTIVDIDGTDVRVVSSLGDSKLGGKDFDRALAGVIKDEYMTRTWSALFDDEPGCGLLSQAEDIKKTLSRRDKTKVVVMGPAGPKGLEITRSHFENAISGYLGKIESLLGIVLDEAGIKESAIDHVLLVGGSTRIPCIQRGLEKRFEKKPAVLQNLSGCEVRALGAAIYAGLHADPGRLTTLQKEEMEKVNLRDAAEHSALLQRHERMLRVLKVATRDWNSRVSSPDPEVRGVAEEMLELIAHLRRELLD